MSAPPKQRPVSTPASTVTALVELVVAQLADAVAARLGSTGPLYYDARSIPPEVGAHLFLKAAQAKEFPSFVVGNRVVARRDDVHRWMESRPFASKAKPRKRKAKGATKTESANEALLRRANLAPRAVASTDDDAAGSR